MRPFPATRKQDSINDPGNPKKEAEWKDVLRDGRGRETIHECIKHVGRRERDGERKGKREKRER